MKVKKSYPQVKGSNSQKTNVFQHRNQRKFSEELKKKKVREIEMGLYSVKEVREDLDVSKTSVYKWIKKYSLHYKRPIQIVVESKSESKRVSELKKELKQAQELVGKKQMELEFYMKMLELASEDLGVDLKKKYSTQQ